MTPVQKMVLIAAGAGGVWKVQDWRYGKKLTDFAATQVQDIAMAERLARKEEQRRYSAAE